MGYRYVVEDEVMDAFIRATARQRERLLQLFELLAAEAPIPHEIDHQDSSGRTILRRDFNGWSVWFWYDGPVQEMRIVELERRR